MSPRKKASRTRSSHTAAPESPAADAPDLWLLEARVMGLVQGIGFRWHVASAATKLGLGGHVRNRPDGSVSLAATGQRAALESLLALFRQGPRGARVNRVEAAWSQLPGTAAPGRFEILH